MTTGWLSERSRASLAWSWNSLAISVTLVMENHRFRAGICKIIWPRSRSPIGSGNSHENTLGKNGEPPLPSPHSGLGRDRIAALGRGALETMNGYCRFALHGDDSMIPSRVWALR